MKNSDLFIYLFPYSLIVLMMAGFFIVAIIGGTIITGYMAIKCPDKLRELVQPTELEMREHETATTTDINKGVCD